MAPMALRVFRAEATDESVQVQQLAYCIKACRSERTRSIEGILLDSSIWPQLLAGTVLANVALWSTLDQLVGDLFVAGPRPWHAIDEPSHVSGKIVVPALGKQISYGTPTVLDLASCFQRVRLPDSRRVFHFRSSAATASACARRCVESPRNPAR